MSLYLFQPPKYSIYYEPTVRKIDTKEDLNKLLVDNIEANMDIFVGYFSKYYNRGK